MMRKHAYYPYFDISEVSSKLEESQINTLYNTMSKRNSSIEPPSRISNVNNEIGEWI